MPRIMDEWLDSVIYLYRSPEDARDGKRSGGSGFLITMEAGNLKASAGVDPNIYSEALGRGADISAGAARYIYAVTNSHVVSEESHLGQSPVIRFNTRDGQTDVLDLSFSQWRHHPEDEDLAVALIDVPSSMYSRKALRFASLMDEGIAQMLSIGPGDEVFCLQRFVGHDGKQRNEPVVRFGTIAMNPVLVTQPRRHHDQLSYLIEMHSLGGASGSPVLLYFRPDFDLAPGLRPNVPPLPHMAEIIKAPWIMGIDCGHIELRTELFDEGGKILDERLFVLANSSMMQVVPATMLRKWLMMDDMRKERERKEHNS